MEKGKLCWNEIDKDKGVIRKGAEDVGLARMQPFRALEGCGKQKRGKRDIPMRCSNCA